MHALLSLDGDLSLNEKEKIMMQDINPVFPLEIPSKNVCVFVIKASIGNGMVSKAESTYWINQFPKAKNINDFFEHG